MSPRDRNWEQEAERMLRSYPPPLGELCGRAISSADDRRGVLEAILQAQIVASSGVVVVGASGLFEDFDRAAVRHLEALLAGLGDCDRLAVVGVLSVLEGLLADGPTVRLTPPPTR